MKDFISELERQGELVRVSAAVDPVLEIAEIADREAKRPGGGRALLFENTGTEFPVIVNALGSQRRIALALGATPDEIAARIDTLFGKVLAPKYGLGEKLRMLPMLGEMARWFPKISKKKGECQQVVLRGEEARLSLLPVLKCWPHDGGRFVTLPMVNTTDPDTGMRNVGMYRMQITGERTTGMHWHVHKTGERHYRAWARHGGRMPVSVCLGGDPVYTYAATAPMPDNMDEYLLAGFLRRRAVRLVKCLTNDIYVPADCDFVIEGYVDPAEPKFTEGPFGDHTGFYSLEDQYPTFHVTAITHRRGAVWPATVVGVPPQEDFYIGQATERIFLAPMRFALQPEVVDLLMPAAGTIHNLALISIDCAYAGQAFKVASSIWGAGQMMFNKILLVTSAADGLRDMRTVARLMRNADLREDAMWARGVLDILDHATATPGAGGKFALDLTVGRADKQPFAPDVLTPPCWAESIDTSMAAEWGAVVLHVAPEAVCDAVEWLADSGLRDVNFLVLADPATRGLTPEELLWFVLAAVDPARDMRMHGSTLVIDARTKAPYRDGYPTRVPNVVVSDAATRALVDSRWPEYGLGDHIASPSERYAALVYGDGAEIKI
ncbi:MAG: menaquinone biosynthesis decarboxylase [Rikenellaceae bacterium]|nr:menaquinone biosynthesis decarboxylase [Rikenellaceae bacterium]MCL2691929.1 menaquinone biosynthesis decarboxylase [Rikenellaceae bacterium]